MNLPVMAPGMDREVTLAWCRGIDEGPWSSLAIGERITFPNPEMLTTLAAAAAVTDRVRLVTNVAVLPMHDPVWLAKQLATVDVLSGGRLVVGVGVGGREEDYRAVGAEWEGSRLQRLEDGVARMRAMWSGVEPFDEALRPVEPAPLQNGGPPVLSGSLGPRSIARAATWSDGVIGFSFGLGAEELAHAIGTVRGAWREAGRDVPPRFVTGAFFALGDDGTVRMHGYLERYLNFMGPLAEHIIPTATLTSESALAAAIERCEAAGVDELLLVPTTTDVGELGRAASVAFR